MRVRPYRGDAAATTGTGCRLVDVPFGIVLEFPGYDPGTVPLDHLPCRPLVKDLADVLLGMVNTAGTVKSPNTALVHLGALGRLARTLDAAGHDGGIAELSFDQLLTVWTGDCHPDDERLHRQYLRAWSDAGRPLDPELDAHVRDGVPLTEAATSNPVAPYSPAETRRLTDAGMAQLADLEARLAHGRQLVDDGRDPDATVEARAAAILADDGPMSGQQLAGRLGMNRDRFYAQADTHGLHAMLFPTALDTLAVRVLLALGTGIVPEGLNGMTVDDVDWPAADTVKLSWFKARGTGRSAATFPAKARTSPGQVLRRWLAATAQVRDHAPPADRGLLLIGYLPTHRSFRPAFRRPTRRKLVATHDVHADDGTPLQLNFKRLRTTYFAQQDRAWHGAHPIDPTHSLRVEGDHYLTRSRPTDAVDDTIEAAQHGAVRTAELAAAHVLDEDDLADLIDDPAAAADRLDLDASAAREVLDGRRDVFAAACSDFYASPFAPAGQPCSAPVWACLGCDLAVFTPRHLPNLLRLRDHLDRQWDLLTSNEWMRMYGPALVRLDRDLLPRFDDATVAAARAELTRGDHEPLPLYLPPEDRHR